MSVSGVDRLDPARKFNKPVPLSQRAYLGRWDKNIRLSPHESADVHSKVGAPMSGGQGPN
jgi:hypothetical protein